MLLWKSLALSWWPSWSTKRQLLFVPRGVPSPVWTNPAPPASPHWQALQPQPSQQHSLKLAPLWYLSCSGGPKLNTVSICSLMSAKCWGIMFPWISCSCSCSYSPGCCWSLCCQDTQSAHAQLAVHQEPQEFFHRATAGLSVYCPTCGVEGGYSVLEAGLNVFPGWTS